MLVFTDKKMQLPKYGHTVDIVLWGDSERVSRLNVIDYDGVVVDLKSVEDGELGDDIVGFNEVFNSYTVLNILKEHGTFIAVLGNPGTTLDGTPFYNFLGFNLDVTEKGGDRLKDVNPRDKFFDYLSSVGGYSYFYDNKVTLIDEMSNLMKRAHGVSYAAYAFPALETRSGHLVSSILNILRRIDNSRGSPEGVFSGSLQLTPVLGGDVKKSIVSILSHFLGDASMDEPDWAASIPAIGQLSLEQKIAKEQEIINKHQSAKDGYVDQLSEIRRSVEVLYKSDKPLESSVKWYFERVGIAVIEPEVDNEAEFYFEFNDKKFVVEVKSTSKDSIDKKGLRQVAEWQDEILIDTGDEYKPVLIASVQYSLPPEERNENFLPDNLVKFAEKKKIAVVSVSYIFKELQKVESGDVKLSDFIDSLYKLDGMVNLNGAKDKS